MARALVMLAPLPSKAVVMPPAALVTAKPAATGWLVSLFLASTSWLGGLALEPSVKVNSLPPVPPAAVATVNLSEVLRVKAIGEPVVEMLLPPL